MINEKMLITKNTCIAPNIYEMTVQGDLVDLVLEPGQFVHIKVTEGPLPLLRRPISIASVDKSTKELTLIYRVDGVGTKTLSLSSQGDRVEILGPLGHGFPLDVINQGETAVLVGGGIGVPPLYELSKSLSKKGIKVIHVLGFRTLEDAFYQKQFEELGKTVIVTDDGSSEFKGTVIDALQLLNLNYQVMYACGPTPMLAAIENGYSDKPLYLSLEQRMGCAVGACMACVCHTVDEDDEKGYRKVCSDGPVFKSGEVKLSC
ncbi:dihydroorotate dehydrogenase electron transfer subunit [Terrilactibacillus laevilacticus]|uniref:dihydroorotate dehydrogenase electron transfer subunit n=1 Tax=Terrilactibacillus laevilacticus TaxID=1380157 RepID=UPI00114618D0|nr:dihydroorotate dehydrogenase electron transfer subunit [Terrilactibacillus laevilacticus]